MPACSSAPRHLSINTEQIKLRSSYCPIHAKIGGFSEYLSNSADNIGVERYPFLRQNRNGWAAPKKLTNSISK
jgi:hypothetical protein